MKERFLNKLVTWFLFTGTFAIILMPFNLLANQPITVGGKAFTEQIILAELAKQVLEKHNYDVTLKTGLGTVIARHALEAGQIDMYYEYTGTAYTVFYKQKDIDIMTNPDKIFGWVKSNDAKKDLVWLDTASFNNTYSLMMQKTKANELGIHSISDLAKAVKNNKNKLLFAMNAEFWERPDGFKKLSKKYGFRVPTSKIKKMDPGLIYTALKNGQVDIGLGFATDGRIAAFGFVNLMDDQKFFPVYNPAPVIRKSVLNKSPEIKEILKKVAEKLTNDEMQTMNATVDIDKKPVGEVVSAWLKKNGIL